MYRRQLDRSRISSLGLLLDDVDTLLGEDVEVARVEIDRRLSTRKFSGKIIPKERCLS